VIQSRNHEKALNYLFMKKKHLNGKLSLRVRDLSALDGNSQNRIVGGFTLDNSQCPQCEGSKGCSLPTCNTATLYNTCTKAGNSVNQCFACAPTYEYQTCPPNAGCATTNVTAIC